MFEESVIRILTGVGGFGGFIATVLMVWFLRSQHEGSRLTRELVGEVVSSRRESSQVLAEVIANNTAAMLKQSAVVQQVCDSLTQHDRQAQLMHRDVRTIADTLRIRLSSGDNHAE